jgi:hypothetical protein
MRTAGILFAGIATTFFTLLFVMGIRGNVNLLGFYVYSIFPIGALLVGWMAASGYLLVTRLTKFPISAGLHFLIITIHFASFFLMDYLYLTSKHLIHVQDGSPVGYWEYFDAIARSTTFRSQMSTNPSHSLGIFGYFFTFLKVFGFVSGTFFINAALDKSQICQSCNLCLEDKIIGVLPADQTRLPQTQECLNQLQDSLDNGDIETTIYLIEQNRMPDEEASEAIEVVRVRLNWCPGCYKGWFRAKEIGVEGEVLIEEELPPDQMVTLAVYKWTR